MSVGLKRSLDGQVGREHRRLSVFGLLEFILGLFEFLLRERGAQHETGEGFAAQHLNHRLVGLRPHLRWCGESLHQVRGHADVLAALPRIHVNGLRLGRQRCLVGDEDALRLQKAPLGGVHHGLAGQGLSLREFRPGGGDDRHAERCCGIERRTGVLERLRQTVALGVLIEERAIERLRSHGSLEFLQRRGRKEQNTALDGFEFLVAHRGGKGSVEN